MGTPHNKAVELTKEAFDLVDLATTYADDGAFLTAADRLEAAAKAFREAYAARQAWLGDVAKPND